MSASLGVVSTSTFFSLNDPISLHASSLSTPRVFEQGLFLFFLRTWVAGVTPGEFALAHFLVSLVVNLLQVLKTISFISIFIKTIIPKTGCGYPDLHDLRLRRPQRGLLRARVPAHDAAGAFGTNKNRLCSETCGGKGLIVGSGMVNR